MNIFDRQGMEVGFLERLTFVQVASAPGGVVGVVGKDFSGVVGVLDVRGS